MNYSIDNAKALYKGNEYGAAKLIYSKLWSDNLKNNYIDKWLGWEYARLLKLLGEQDQAIDICKTIYKKHKDFKHNKDLLSWCLYEKYLKNLPYESMHKDWNQLIRIAEFILKITQQENGVPYENTVWKIVKLHKEPFRAELICEWLNKLDVNKLSESCKTVKNGEKNIELASPKEEWLYLMCKSLKELGKYKECIEVIELAITSIGRFHNDRDIWMQVERAECLAELGNKEGAIDLLKQLLIKKEHWVLHKTIFKIKIMCDKVEEGLVSAYTAALSKDPLKVKVNLYYEIGKVLENNMEYRYALMHYILSKKVKMENGWSVPSELDNRINKLGNIIKVDSDNLFNELKDYWSHSKLRSSKRLEGVILRILQNGKSGFIKTKNESYYFKIKSFIMSKIHLEEGMKVSFSLIDSFDNKKNIATKEAVDILKI